MRILVVEDEPVESKLAVHVLAAEGHEVDFAWGAEDALAASRRQKPDVILLDLRLPGVDGLTLARTLKAEPATLNVPIVAVTSYPENYSADEVRAAGCDAYLHKPLSTRTLAETLADVVEEKKRARR